MDLEEMSQGIRKLSVAERLILVEEMWDSNASEQEHLELAEAQRRELARRLESYRASPEDASSCEEVKTRLIPST